MKNILFSGVHGVGKGYFLNNRSNKEEYKILSASELIRQFKEDTDAGYKKVANVKINQDVLLLALQKEQSSSDNVAILDGHLCILNAENEVEKIPEYFFEKANIVGIILLQDNVEIILKRIQKRDAVQFDISQIQKIQEMEKDYAEYLYKVKGIKYEIVSHQCTEKQFNAIVSKLGGEGNGEK